MTMLHAPIGSFRPPHVVVVGNEKGGSGKTTIAMHIAVALMRAGQRVAIIDLDSRQQTLTHYIANRRAWSRRTGTNLDLPALFTVPRAQGPGLAANEATEFAAFDGAITAVQHGHDFVVIDTPPHDGHLMRLAHATADTLVTPLNDSFLDLDVLATVDPVSLAAVGVSHYAEMVTAARRERRSLDGALPDWVTVRNRLSPIGMCLKPAVGEALCDLALRLGFRVVTGFAERPVYRDLFPRGLTALDDLRHTMPCVDPDPSCLAARHEVGSLLACLKLPLDQRGRDRLAAKAQWVSSRDVPLEMDDVVNNDVLAPSDAQSA